MKRAFSVTITFLLIVIIGLLSYIAFFYVNNLNNYKSAASNVKSTIASNFGSSSNIPDIVDKTSPSVVQIIAMNKDGSPSALGSGVIINGSKGYIVTNNHVVSDSTKFKVRFSNGSQSDATITGTSPEEDLAVLKLSDYKNLPQINLGDSSLTRIGETAIAIGSPLDLKYANTVTAGVISGLEREIPLTLSNSISIISVLQTDAPINPGNSGGALINSKGELIGICNAKISLSGYEGLGFAIPVNTVKTVCDEIIATGKYQKPHLGIGNIYIVDPEEAKNSNGKLVPGVKVGTVEANSNAAKLNIKPGDIIMEVNGNKITSIGTLGNELLASKKSGKITAKIYRDNKVIILSDNFK